MHRIDRARLNAASFPVTERIVTRYDDVDMQGHVNNAAAVVILQEARAAFNRRVGLPDALQGLKTMVAALHVEYAGEMRHPGEIEIGTGVLAFGRTSFTLTQIGRQEGRPCLYAEAVMVIADANGAVPLPDRLRGLYGRYLLA